MIKNLIVYNYISDINHVLVNKYLFLYKNVFDGIKVIYHATDIDLNDTEKNFLHNLYSFLSPTIVKFVRNHPENRESEYFISQLNDIKELSEKDSITFYTHSKGSTYNTRNVNRWAACMYFFNLEKDNLRKIESGLSQDKIFAGIFRVDFPCPPWVHSDWHFSGTFFWFSHKLFEIDGWNSHYVDRFSTESYPGFKVDISKSYNVDDIINHGCDLRYDYYWDTFFQPSIIGVNKYERFYQDFH